MYECTPEQIENQVYYAVTQRPNLYIVNLVKLKQRSSIELQLIGGFVKK